MPNKLAFDRASVRTTDVNGRMHVELTNISVAAVNPYLGKEIPGFKELGLESDRIYQLLRDPGELAKAAPTFDNLPLLSEHVPVFADKPEKSLVVGSTGTDAEFVAPYLKNSLVVWDLAAIKAIESGQQRELSCSYFYRPDMTPGIYEGMHYDGVMRDIKANHVALVETGRAGPDVLVSDANPFQTFKPLEKIHMKNPQRVARQSAALAVALSPLLAMDTSIKPDEFVKNLALALDAAEPDGDEPIPKKPAEDEQGPDESDEDYAARMQAKKSKLGEDEDEDEDDDVAQDEPPNAPPVPAPSPAKGQQSGGNFKEAMLKAMTKARADAIADMQAIHAAEKEAYPHIGEVGAMDSAADIYKTVLTAANIDLTGVPKAAYRAMVRMLPKPGDVKTAPRMAQDSAAAASFNERYPTAAKPARSY